MNNELNVAIICDTCSKVLTVVDGEDRHRHADRDDMSEEETRVIEILAQLGLIRSERVTSDDELCLEHGCEGGA